jgi:uncharacterized protein (DUF4415 family)
MKLATTAKLPKKTSAKVNDPDNPAWTEEMLGLPVIKRGRGPQVAPTKVLTSVRLDADILEFFKAQGRGYQTRINDALRLEVDRSLAARSKATLLRKRAVA